MLYLVDGYNITRADDATRRLPLDRQRDALVARMRVRGADILGPGRIVVVFDGTPEPGEGAAETGGPVRVVFSRGESADDLIVRLAASAGEKVVLVSSDAELRDRVRAAARHDVELRRSSAAWEPATGPSGKRRAKGRGRGRFPAATAGLPPGANRITEEMKRIWLSGEEAGDAEDGRAGEDGRTGDDCEETDT